MRAPWLLNSPVILVAATLLVPGTSGDGPAAAEFSVAPDGRDDHPGTRERPFATLGRARDAVREIIARGLETDVTVLIRGGTHRVRAPLVLGLADSGTDRHRVTWAAHPGETPLISGGREITGFKRGEDGVLEVVIPEVRSGKWRFRELFVNGERRPRARHPDTGYLRIEKAGPDNRTSFTYPEGDLREYDDLAGVELVFLHDWSISRIGIEAIDEGTRTVKLRDPVGPSSRHFAMTWFEPRPRYFLENSVAFLDRPGEWCLDESTGTLRYRPLQGETADSLVAVAPLARGLLVVRGDERTARPVKNLRFVGLHFEHCAWPLPPRGYAAGQAGFHERREGSGGALREPLPAAIHFELAENCRIESGRIAHVGRSALWFGRQCRNNAVIGTVISDVSGNGVMIGEDRNRRIGERPWWQAAPGEAATGNVVKNNVIEQCGRQFYGCVGVWVGMAEKTVIAHNEIRHHPYTGVSVGWMWNPTPTPCKANIVEYNHIHHVMQILSDGGGIYTLGIQPGSVLRGNLIHDVPLNSGRAESNGMFLDEGTTSLVIEDNVIYNTVRSPLRFHRATTNLVRDNVLVVASRDVPPFRYNRTEEKDIRKESNTIREKEPGPLPPSIRRAGLEPDYRKRLEP